MLRHERRLLIDCLGIGVALTLLVIAADASGLLNGLEDSLYDLRARTCQRFIPKPTDTLVHIDIDDPALDTIGWPLPRATVGKILDEIRLAGPKAVEMDVLFDQPQKVQFEQKRAPATTHANTQLTTQSTTQSATQPAVEYVRIDHDAELAAAMRRLGNVIVPATFQPPQPYSPIIAAMVQELRKDAELEPAPLAELLRKRGDVHIPEAGLGEQFFVARREAFDLRLRELNLGPGTPFELVRAAVLPRTPMEITTGAANVLREQWTKYLAGREFRKFAWPRPDGMSSFGNMRIALAPVRDLSASAAGGAFVDYTQFGSPVIRALPLLLEADGNVYPQMGLALACRMLDADVTKLRVVGGNELVVPRGGGKPDLVIPLAPPRVSTSGMTYGQLMPIPWFGGRQWENMYDWPSRKSATQHVPLNEVWQAVVAREKVIRNNEQLDEALRAMFITMDLARLRDYDAKLPPADDFDARLKWIKPALDDAKPYLQAYSAMKPEQLDPTDRIFLATTKTLERLAEHGPPLVKDLRDFRAKLATQLNGKAVIVGWSATAAIADFVPTSLHEKCPGAVVHGVVYNGIMTGELWRTAPWWISALTTFMLGSLISFTTARFAPLKAFMIALAVACAFAIVNGTLLFDRFNLLLGAAAPLVAIAAVWAACTLTRVIIEASERSRITRRFSNYVDPKIVDYVMENPQVTFDGETREMTVVFTDLAGFTAISERLGEKVVPMLNELFGELVPVIRRNEGTLNKFLGDGIMFFFNAPRNMPSHAAVAVKAVLEMHEKVAEFNQRLAAQGLPELSMRAGVMTAEMIVGDAGGAGAADYTVLGDAVNTGSRLEAANKATGTRTLISARTADMLNGEFLIRPIGKLKVVGKDESVMVFEPMAATSRATESQRELAKCSAEMVDSFLARDFARTLKLVDEIDARFGPSKITAIYRTLSQRFIDKPPDEAYDGRIVLTEK
jgi:class 3 adenylate cyclase/CHASE2 domain-containing sensor protein